MLLNRRTFLGTLAASVAGMMLPSDVLWKPLLDSPRVLKPLSPSAIVGLEQMTDALHRELLGLVETRPRSFSPKELLIGQSVPVFGNPVTMTDQLNVSFEHAPDEIDHFGLDRDRYITPIAQALGHSIRDRKINTFGVLPHPRGYEFQSAIVDRDNLAVRGVCGWMVDPDGDWRLVTRFDVLGGTA